MDEKTAKALNEMRKLIAKAHDIDEKEFEMTVNCRSEEIPPNAENYDWCGDFEDDDDYDDGDCQCGVIGCEECDERYYEDYDCGMTSDGTCTKAGSEDCDWECPYSE